MMQRQLIKADGTVYAVKQGRGWDTPARVVETERLWSYNINHRTQNTVSLARPERKMSASSGSPGVWQLNWSYVGFLVIRADRGSTDALQTLREFDMSHVRDMSTDKANIISTWNDVLPEGLTLDVAVAREFLDTWESAEETAKREREERIQEQEKFRLDQMRAAESETRVNKLLKSYGVRQVYGAPPAHKKYITLDADALSGLLEKLDPQRVLDAVADH